MRRGKYKFMIKETGFTIIETMISLAIFGTILLLVSIIVINISNTYYKGINESATQDDARNIINQVSQDLELNPGPISTGSMTVKNNITINSYCVGTVRYSYVVGYRIGNSNSTEPDGSGASSSNIPFFPHVLWRDTIGSGNNCTPANLTDITTTGTELMASNSRLTEFNITPVNPPYTVSVGVAYGNIELLNNNTPSAIASADNTIDGTECAGDTGDQYCATSYLSTIVTPQVSN